MCRSTAFRTSHVPEGTSIIPLQDSRNELRIEEELWNLRQRGYHFACRFLVHLAFISLLMCIQEAILKPEPVYFVRPVPRFWGLAEHICCILLRKGSRKTNNKASFLEHRFVLLLHLFLHGFFSFCFHLLYVLLLFLSWFLWKVVPFGDPQRSQNKTENEIKILKTA